MKHIIKYIPGFRSHKAWKMIIAFLYYSCSLIILFAVLPFGLILFAIPLVLINLISSFKKGEKQTEYKYNKEKEETIDSAKSEGSHTEVTNLVSVNKISTPNCKVNIFTKKWRKICNEFIALDIETTGLNSNSDKIIEIAAHKYKDGILIDSYSTLINPQCPIPKHITKINGITNEMVKNSPCISEAMSGFIYFIGDNVLSAHNASFDIGFLKRNAKCCGFEIENPVLDTLQVCRKLYPSLENHKLKTVTDHLNINVSTFHRAGADAKAVGDMVIEFIRKINDNEQNKNDKIAE